MKHRFFSPLCPEECVQTFNESVDKYPTLTPDPRKPFRGKVSGDRFQLRAKSGRRNSFAPVFFGRFQGQASGTIIEGHFAMSPLVRIFIALWFGFFVLAACCVVGSIGGNLISTYLANEGNLSQIEVEVEPEAIVALVPLLAMPLAGIGLVLFGKSLGKGDQLDILHFLETAFQAGPLPSESDWGSGG